MERPDIEGVELKLCISLNETILKVLIVELDGHGTVRLKVIIIIGTKDKCNPGPLNRALIIRVLLMTHHVKVTYNCSYTFCEN